MGFQVGINIPSDRDPMDDQVFREQFAAWNRQDGTDDFAFEEVEVEYGPKPERGPRSKAKVKLRFALDGRYMFAVYGDNKALHSQERDEWDTMARNALEKFAGANGFRVMLGPRPEDHNRYNYMVEFDRAIREKPETIELHKQEEAARQKAAARRQALADLGILPEVEAQRALGPYQPIRH